jgi:hypothetical protein
VAEPVVVAPSFPVAVVANQPPGGSGGEKPYWSPSRIVSAA